MGKALGFSCTLVAAVALAAACTVHQSADAPSLTGPSVPAHSLRVSTDTSSISQNGVATAKITVSAFGPSGAPQPNVPVRLDMEAPDASGVLVLQDFGTLSARTVQTGTDGTQTVVFTAPPAPPTTSSGSSTHVTIVATGTSAPFDTAQASTDIRLVPPGVILPPAGTPKAAFVSSPTPAAVNVAVTFDASSSCAETDSSGACTVNGSIASFAWNFGDGATASGKVTSHTFTSASAFAVTLTVTNSRLVAASTTQTITATFTASPSAKFEFSPTTPAVSQAINFDASESKAATGHQIVAYSWIFGDGATASGTPVSHTFATAGTYNVTLTVTDDTGQTATSATAVNVGTGSPTATFTASVFNAGTHTMTLDASGSTAVPPATVATYAWAFGDGQFAAASASPTINHTFISGTGTYSVRVTVVDSVGRSSSFTVSVAVP